MWLAGLHHFLGRRMLPEHVRAVRALPILEAEEAEELGGAEEAEEDGGEEEEEGRSGEERGYKAAKAQLPLRPIRRSMGFRPMVGPLLAPNSHPLNLTLI